MSVIKTLYGYGGWLKSCHHLKISIHNFEQFVHLKYGSLFFSRNNGGMEVFFSPWQLDSGVFMRMASEDRLRGFAGRLLILDLRGRCFSGNPTRPLLPFNPLTFKSFKACICLSLCLGEFELDFEAVALIIFSCLKLLPPKLCPSWKSNMETQNWWFGEIVV